MQQQLEYIGNREGGREFTLFPVTVFTLDHQKGMGIGREKGTGI